MSGCWPPCSATVTFCRALSLLTYCSWIWMFGCSRVNCSTWPFSEMYSWLWLTGGGGVKPIHITSRTTPPDGVEPPVPPVLPDEHAAPSRTAATEAAMPSLFIGHLSSARRAAARDGLTLPGGGIVSDHSVIRIAVLLQLWPIVHPGQALVKGSRGGRPGRAAARAGPALSRDEQRLDRIQGAVHQRGEDAGALGERGRLCPAQVPAPQQVRGLAELIIAVGERALDPLLRADQRVGVEPGRLLGEAQPDGGPAGAELPYRDGAGRLRADRVEDHVVLAVELAAGRSRA